jgi:hypothetical protein
MSDTAHRLRAQKAYSTDPAYLERIAREEETRCADPNNDGAAEGGSVPIARPISHCLAAGLCAASGAKLRAIEGRRHRPMGNAAIQSCMARVIGGPA